MSAKMTGNPANIGLEDGGGRAVSGEGEAEGPDRAIRAAEAAIADIRPQLRDGERVEANNFAICDQHHTPGRVQRYFSAGSPAIWGLSANGNWF